MIELIPAITFIGYIAVLCYVAATILELRAGSIEVKKLATKLAGWLGGGFHLLTLLLSMCAFGGVSGSFFDALSLTAFIVVLVTYINQQQMNTHLLLAPVFAFSAVCVILAIQFGHYVPIQTPSPGIFAHVVSSITAYALLCLASLQALIVYAVDQNLKHKGKMFLSTKLPSLQGMETQMFRLISSGLIVLTIAIVTGILFIGDLFAQHLIHKTVFTLLSWILFAALLIGRKQAGWRGVTAVKWTLAAFFVLVLAYLGSKFVLDLILHRI